MQSDWKWFGHAGHFICAAQCRFHLCTQVGDKLISTIGDYYDHKNTRQTIGSGPTDYFETFVFQVTGPSSCTQVECQCNMPQVNWLELEGIRHETAGNAMRAHVSYCAQYDTFL